MELRPHNFEPELPAGQVPVAAVIAMDLNVQTNQE